MIEDRNFNSTLYQGNEGQNKIKEYLESQGYIVIDKSEDEEYQSKDIDFLYSKDGLSFCSLEVKSDNRMYETGNIAVELAMHRKSGRKNGWYHYCEADVLCFYDVISNIGYFIDWVKLKKEIQNQRWSFTVFENKIDLCKGSLCLVPVKDLENLNLLHWVTRIEVA